MAGLMKQNCRQRLLHLSLLLTGLLCSPVGSAASSAVIGDPLQRPALTVSHPQQAFYNAAVQAGQRLVLAGEHGLVIFSDDQGQNWQQARVPVSVGLTALAFSDERNGMAVGHGGTVLVTSDSGSSWKAVLNGHQAAILLQQYSARTANAELADYASSLAAEGADKPFLDVLMFDRRHALVVGAYGLVFETRNGGDSWEPSLDRLDNPDLLHFYSISRRGNQILMAGEAALVNLSNDGGATFRKVEVPYDGSFFTSAILADGRLLVAGLKGNIWVSDDQGDNWYSVPAGLDASLTDSVEIAPGRLLLGSQAGVLLQLDGNHIQPLASRTESPVNALLPTGNRLLLATMDGIRFVRQSGN